MLIGETDEKKEKENEFEITSEEDLKNKIIEYEKYKTITETFKELEEKRSEFYTKSPSSLKEYQEIDFSNDGSITLDDLIKAFLDYQERINLKKPLHTKITKKELSVEERMVSIKERLAQEKRVDFFDLFEEKTKEYLIVTFLAILEMNKNDEVHLIQERNFDRIFVESR